MKLLRKTTYEFLMKRSIKLALPFIAGFIGYLIGSFLPIDILKPSFSGGSLTISEYYRLVVSIISAFITFIAVIVALFKDDLRELWKRPKIEFGIPPEMTIEDLNTPFESETNSDTPIASRYISRIEVKNVGNLPALNTEIYLEKLEFIPKDSTIVQNIEASSSSLKWNSKESQSIIIPPGGKKLVQIVEIIPGEKVSTPDSVKQNKPPTLIIGDIHSGKDKNKGKWTAKFSLYAQNHKPTSFVVEIDWNGVWKTRLTEFKNQYQIVKKA